MIYAFGDDIPLLSQWIKKSTGRNLSIFGGDYRARTCDPLLVRQMLSQLS